MTHLKSRAIDLCATLRRLTLVAAIGVLNTLASANPQCPSDLDADGFVGGSDISLALMEFGPCSDGAPCPADFDGDATVTTADISLLLLEFGDCPTWYTVLEQDIGTSFAYVELRAAIIATGKPWRVRDNSTGIEMVLIPPGTYTMGCSDSFSYSCSSNETQHQVTLTNAFYLSRTEVTQAQWVAVMGSNPSFFQGNNNRPVERVTWNAAQLFCAATGLRLPSEAEWEYAYRAGSTFAFHGATPDPRYGSSNDMAVNIIAWYGSNSGNKTQVVAGKRPNDFGLYDMAGNVMEWCQDWYGTYAASAQINPSGPGSGTFRVLRGGGWGSSTNECRASRRNSGAPGSTSWEMGFRVARNP